jgi:predicted hydrolase (HD superfamily)
MHKPNIKYRVTLTEEEREFLEKLIKKGKTAGYRIRHAQLLLALDEIPENKAWTDEKIGKAYGAHVRSIGNLRKRFVEEGFEAALERKKREVPPHIKIDGEVEAKIIALACSDPPEGRCKWTLQLLADKVVELEILDSISHTAIGNTLKKTTLNRGYANSGV